MDAFSKAYSKNKKILPEDEIAELYLLAHKGCKDSIEKLFWSTCGLILKRAFVHSTKNKVLTFEELFSAGCEGFFKGIRNGCFNPNKGKWTTYIGFYINGYMKGEKLDQTVIHFPRYLGVNYPYAIEELIDKHELKEGPLLLEVDESNFLKEALNLLTKKERFVITERFFKNKTLVEIGKHFGITRERARQIEASALQKLKELLPNLP